MNLIDIYLLFAIIKLCHYKGICMENKSLGVYKILLTVLCSSLVITGVSYIDDKIWNFVFLILGMITYSIVGILYSIKILHGRSAGKEAYCAIFIILMALGYCVYSGIVTVQNWIAQWQLWAKITVPSILVVLIVLTIIIIVYKKKKSKIEKIVSTTLDEKNNE